jgi:biofilm PGA synthesis N-glycosyltransferase PgaC
MPSRTLIIGICAYNEENNIASLLQNLVTQNTPEKTSILVMCSGCTDRTPQIVADFQKKDSRITLVVESVRRGKSNALNKIFKAARGHADVLVLVNADALPEVGSIHKLVSKLNSPDTGAVFAQPVPRRSNHEPLFGVTRLIWRLHHVISLLETPKLSGELCAIKTVYLQEIPENTATDEPYIERSIQKQNRKILYVPDAEVHIRCPSNIADMVEQRKRIWIGHMQFQSMTGYKVSTSSLRNILRALHGLEPKELLYVLPGGLFEAVAYVQARTLFVKGLIPSVWKPIRSTKSLK